MPKLDLPLQLAPVFKPKIWGRTSLAPIFESPEEPRRPRQKSRSNRAAAADRKDPETRIGEAWLTDDTARFRTGPVAGLTLGEVSREYGDELHGASWLGECFPILAKYLFTSDWLSVQVHPDDAQARSFGAGSVGKCEMWYIIGASDPAACLLGAKPGVTKEALAAACRQGKSRDLLNRFHPEAGEAIFVPPGTFHALGPGLVLFEAEQNSDLTYRLDDFGRLGPDGKPRPLHLEKGLAVAQLELPARRNLPRLEFPEPFGSRRYVVACPFFAVEEWTLARLASLRSSSQRVEAFSVVSGEGRVETAAGWMGFHPGETWLVPPGVGPYRLVPIAKTQCRLLRFYIPDLERDFRAPLARLDVAEENIRRVVFD